MISVVLACVYSLSRDLPISAIDCNFCPPGDGDAIWVSWLRQEKKPKTPKTQKTPGSSDNQQSSQGVPRRRRKFFVQSDKAIDGRHIEASINGGTPIAGWLISWKILLKWMIWGSPHFRKPPYCGIFRYMRYCDINHSVISCIYTLEQPFFMGLIWMKHNGWPAKSYASLFRYPLVN